MVDEVVEQNVLKVLEAVETQLDENIKKYDNVDEDELERLRQNRIQAMKSRAREVEESKARGHGEYTEVMTEAEFFQMAKKSKFVAAHFYRPSTWRCQIIDGHLDKIARKHLDLRCLKINVEKAPFLAKRLNIIMIPTVMLIKDGKTDHSIIGFDEFGGTDRFTTRVVEAVLRRHQMIKPKKHTEDDTDDDTESDEE